MEGSQTYEEWLESSHFSGPNAYFLEEMYEKFLVDPDDVPEEWRSIFSSLKPSSPSISVEIPHSGVRKQVLENTRDRKPSFAAPDGGSIHELKQIKVLQLIEAYRNHGHKKADIDPLGLREIPEVSDLAMENHELYSTDLSTSFKTDMLHFGQENMTLKALIEALEATYCGTTGIQCSHVEDVTLRNWIIQKYESIRSRPRLTQDEVSFVLDRLVAAEGLEKYLGMRFSGVKRFGLEGGETLIPMLAQMIQTAGAMDAKEIVIGMAHRGRLNVLVNILGKSPTELFDEFEGKKFVGSSGDVKYHMGFSSNVMTSGGECHLALAFNPSHLAIVSPVVEGSVRARQSRRDDVGGNHVLPVVIHGDAAFSGQGVIMETLQMSQTRGYKTGGTIHIIINNQIGFTISSPKDSRSTPYSTDVAKMIDTPILHVNGDDPEACWFAIKTATEFRQTFHRDIVVDLVCYRRRGHNEADEPSGTQPTMYGVIKKLPSTLAQYKQSLKAASLYSDGSITALETAYRDKLANGENVAWNFVKEPNKGLYVDWAPYLGHDWSDEFDTSYDMPKLQALAQKMTKVPDGFMVQRQVSKVIDDRYKMAAGGLAANWGFAEMLAYATLLEEGFNIRITGQDVRRGTFSHRHAVLHEQRSEKIHISLCHLSEEQGTFDIYDSLLSEEAVLAYEYGYSTTMPNALVIWEAQFGDFANGAQVVIDQFITSGEQKWERLSGLVMLLPHGYEGQGAEHSSARLERYLQLCAENNIQVCVPSTPAQVFHMLRRQIKRPIRKPLVVMSPKSLLRHKLAVSSLEELSEGTFQTLIGEVDELPPVDVTRLVMCSGKVYYDLLEKRREAKLSHVAIVRIEQLYPFPSDALDKIIRMYDNLENVTWCQEEPLNQGCWYTSQHHMRRSVGMHRNKSLYLQCSSRPASAAPASGYMSLHVAEQNKLINDALGLANESNKD